MSNVWKYWPELSPRRPVFSQAYAFNAPPCDVERLNYFQHQNVPHDKLVPFVLRQQNLAWRLFPWWDFLCSLPLELLQHLILLWRKPSQFLFHFCSSHSHPMYTHWQCILYSHRLLNREAYSSAESSGRHSPD